MTAEEARKLQQELDPFQNEFYKNKPLGQSEKEYLDTLIPQMVKDAIDAFYKNPFKMGGYQGTPSIYFSCGWQNENLKKYLLNNGFHISPDGNVRDLFAFWDIRNTK